MSPLASDLSRPVRPKPPKSAHRRDPVILWFIVVIVILGIVGIIQQAYLHTRPDAKTVLDYPVQRVEEPDYLGHKYVTAEGGVVHVTGIKCNISQASVEVAGTVSWISVEPPGVTIQTGQGSASRAPGCFTSHYENPIPDEVIKATRSILKRDPQREFVTWRIVGTETPTDPDQRAETWQSEQFDLYLTSPHESRVTPH